MLTRRQTLLLGVPLLLAGCGFKMRGSFESPYKTLYLDFPKNSPFAVELSRFLYAEARNIRIVNRPDEAQAVLHVLHEDRQRQVSLLNEEGQVREYELTLDVIYNITKPNGEVLHPKTRLSTSRTLAYTEKTYLSQANEEALLYRDMTQTLIQQIVRQFRTFKPL